MKKKNTVNLREFAEMTGASKTYLCDIIRRYVRNVEWSERKENRQRYSAEQLKVEGPYYKGVPIPKPLIGEWSDYTRLWHITDVQRFKKKLDKLIKLFPTVRQINPKGYNK